MRPERRPFVALLALVSLAPACATAPAVPAVPATPTASPRQRYVTALQHRLEGNSKAYFDGLIALAHEAPDSRAGRRARAMLQGSGATALWAAGTLAAIAIPNFLKYQSRAKQSEARQQLAALATAERAHSVVSGHYCASAAACDFPPLSGTRYVYFLGPDVVAGGDLAEDREALVRHARATLSIIGLTPRLDEGGYLFVAVGNIDADADVDVWAIETDGEPVHYDDDIEGTTPSFGL